MHGSISTDYTLGVNTGGMVGTKAEPIPEGMTIGKAIEEQRAFSAKAEMKGAEGKALK